MTHGMGVTSGPAGELSLSGSGNYGWTCQGCGDWIGNSQVHNCRGGWKPREVRETGFHTTPTIRISREGEIIELLKQILKELREQPT